MKTIIINWGALSKFGGIERITYYLIKFMSENGVRVIWLKNSKSAIGDAFKAILSHPNVEIVNVSDNHLFWFKHDKISISKEEQVVVVSYTIFDMFRALSLKNELKGRDVTCFYTIPDTTGNFFFIERYFKGWLKNYVYRHIKSTLSDWNKAGLIFFCAPLQITSFEKNYQIEVANPQSRLIKAMYAVAPLDEEALAERCLRNGKFNIITVGRFDFPHKGYMLGLVKAFGRLKSKYPQMTLTIIGKGKDEQALKDEIDKLDADYKKDIFMVGEVAHSQLPDYYKDKHLSVAVAGSTGDAAKNGVLSLVARNHYSDECEVYGYYAENCGKSVSTEPGEIVDSYIEEAIQMSAEEYVSKIKTTYQLIRNRNINPWMYFEEAQKVAKYEISHSELTYYKIINYLRKVIMLFKRF